MSDTKVLGVEDVRSLLLATVDAHPDDINPTNDDGGCMYTDQDDPDTHCLIGQMAADQGWHLPDVDDPIQTELVYLVASEMGWPVDAEALDLMASVQITADNTPGRPHPWRMVRDTIVRFRK